jgi:N utilization substance protein B
VEKDAIRGRRLARKLALQALYQWQMSGSALSEIEAQFRVANSMEKVDDAYFCKLIHTIPSLFKDLESQFSPYIDREVEALNPIELAVLRLGTYELMHCPEIPYKVVLDEAISLTRLFGSQDGYKYVNGVLNQVAQKIRYIEIG